MADRVKLLRSREESEQAGMQRELTRLRAELTGARRRFDQAREPELVEASIFEINALQARCAWLLRQIREAAP